MTPKISDTEWRVMKILWSRSPLTSKQIIEDLADLVDWSPKTIKTLLNRLLKKNALGFMTNGHRYEYYPLVPEEECARSERMSFLSRVYNGSLTPMFAAFLEDSTLSSEEIEELKRILDKEGRYPK